MKIFYLKQDFTVQQWLEIVNIRENTINSYLLGMQAYTEFTNKNPEQLLNEADKEQDDNIKVRNRAVNKYLYGFRNHLQQQGLAPLTIKNYINGAKSFYRAFDIEFKSVKQEGVTVKQENRKIPTIEDIRDVLKVCDPFEKALILVGCSSGLDGSTICNITVEQFKKGYDSKTGITTLILRRQKTDVDFVTFLTPEASEAVWNYLNYRARTVDTTLKNRLDQLAKQKVYADTNYLFILRKVHVDFLKDFDEEKRKINRSPLMKIYREISTKANKSTEKGKFNYIRSHNCRKFFDSTMLNNGCDYLHTEEYMGHALPGTQGHYFTPNVDELKTYYTKFIPYLTIQKKLNVSESPEYQSIKSENDILRAETAKHVVERSELTELKAEMDRIKARELEVEYNKQEIQKALATLHSTPLPELDPNATSEEREMYQKMLSKHYENQSYLKAIKMMVDMK
ncbi:MAG: tyrosine-type recombinase/integrase [Methanosarcina barkeri]|nr:tyrosine-type recombinase/integrase [Methanosarcina sp. ERenArc_MAG2]